MDSSHGITTQRTKTLSDRTQSLTGSEKDIEYPNMFMDV